MSTDTSPEIHRLLREVFRHERFRPPQEEVCRSVAGGRDALLVMPTGAGKSLCYQIPGLARGGVTLVVSPLIALMEDQVAKLREAGVRAERIHSGRERRESREVCRRYLAGDLDFLFIAPERLTVPGFPAFLARRPPVLVAIDEAHCISHWGHDFRPDYRLLGQHLPALRPAPILALTATATPRVQEDVLRQLGMADAELFIRGFRRHNLAVETVEAPPGARAELVRNVLTSGDQRPAIVYAPSRKETEELASLLHHEAGLAAAPYHAGLPALRRDEVQQAFLGDEIDVIVATIAFGMGVDKPDVRTVIHTALPGSLEGYYQEIGRAGRDGAPSRAILLWSWADRRTQDWFFERSYPEPALLDAIVRSLGREKLPTDRLRVRTGIEEEVFERALEKLWVHGGVVLAAGPPGEPSLVSPGAADWRPSYLEQRRFKAAQIEDVVRFAGSNGCRMVRLVQHFGDREDDGSDCGHCDQCAPESCELRSFRPPTKAEEMVAFRIVAALREYDGQSTGRMFRELCGDGILDRRGFEQVLEALSRAAVLRTEEDTFEKEGRTIRFQRAHLDEGAARGFDELGLEIAESIGGARRRRPARPSREEVRAAVDPAVVERLRDWRTEEARRRRVPAFRILTNRTLENLAATRPANEDDLLAVSGIGPTIADRYGDELLRLIAPS